jgi:hypothetical protein
LIDHPIGGVLTKTPPIGAVFVTGGKRKKNGNN